MNGRRARLEPIRVWRAAVAGEGERVTRVRGDRQDPGLVWIEIDGRRAALVDRSTIRAAGIVEECPWEERFAELLDAEVRERLCLRVSTRLLAARVRSRDGLVRTLIERGFDEADARKCVERFVERGAIDDERFAEIVVRNELARKPAGRRLLESKLRQKGVTGAVAERVIQAALKERDPVEDAREAAAKGMRTMPARLENDAVRRRLSGRLMRRGFDPQVVSLVVREAMEARS